MCPVNMHSLFFSQNGVAVPGEGKTRRLAAALIWIRTFHQNGFDANWEIDVFGGVRRSVEAADATIDATRWR